MPGRISMGMDAIYRRITWRVVPFLILLYLVAFLDRVNISFASLTMNRDLGIGDEVFGLAAGIFFVGYLVFAVPSNLMLMRFGARRWIAAIMVTWGVLSCSMAFVHGTTEYLALRFLIGAAEAGFFPGIILYLTTWLPGSARAGIMAFFTLSIPLSNVVGAPLSAAILQRGGLAGLKGWQLLFLLEGLPAVVLGCVVPWVMASGPEAVGWLNAEEKGRLREAMESEGVVSGLTTTKERAAVGRLVGPASIYFFLMIGLYALGFWVPRILTSEGVTLRWLGWATALPFALGGVGMVVWGGYSDRSARRRGHLAGAFAVAAVGMAAAGMAPGWPVALVGLSAAAVGVLAAMPIFWAGLSEGFSVAAAAMAIAAVNSVGNVGGFLGPYATGWLLKATQSYRAGLLAAAGCLACGMVLVMLASSERRGTA